MTTRWSVAVFAGKDISAMDHQPYSPDFWLFPELKSVLKSKRF
jgi:hypothetical protein